MQDTQPYQELEQTQIVGEAWLRDLCEAQVLLNKYGIHDTKLAHRAEVLEAQLLYERAISALDAPLENSVNGEETTDIDTPLAGE